MCTCASSYVGDLSDIDWHRNQELEVTDSEMKAVRKAHVSVFIVTKMIINVVLFRCCQFEGILSC